MGREPLQNLTYLKRETLEWLVARLLNVTGKGKSTKTGRNPRLNDKI